ncbi:hypothetical protein [Streptococcus loxodontisalivarius]|uniref:Glycosyltransferase RgtA/B/C/D-like domain-containing protein n=2 Tax=Streptococcus loxodontisalivarius TaxID=1349415 RepID=A0ABS2PSK2_9STRE|nr:hypothetical protein [Streptococcus loxodontisalivarius]
MKNRLYRMGLGLSKALQWLVRWGGIPLMGLLFLSSLLVQTIVYLDGGEWAELLPVKIWVFLTLIFFVFILYISRKWFAKQSHKKVFWSLALTYLLIGIVLIAITTDKTRDDAATVFRSAVEINSGNLRFLQTGEYLYRYPHQLGLVTFERLVMKIIPIPSMVIFFVLNLFAVIGINFSTWKTTDLLFKDEQITRYSILLSFAFLPQFFNILFVYGIIFGLFFASFGIYFLLRYLKTKNWKWAAGAIVFLALSYWIRNNYILLLVALSLVLFFETMSKKSFKPILIALAMIGLGWGMNKATVAYYEHLSGQDLSGTPKVTWLAMGLQDDGNSRRQPGWYNHYVRRIYFEKNGDYKAIEADAKASVQESVSYFIQHPAYTWTFFKDKFLSTWMDSTFESIWSGPSRFKKQPLINAFAASLYHGRWLYRILYQITHAILIMIYAGAFLFIAFFKKTDKDAHLKLYPFIYLAGGLVFHLLWETKSQYTSPYVYLLLPFVVAGYAYTFEKWQSGDFKKYSWRKK